MTIFLLVVAGLSLLFAVVPAMLFVVNLRLYVPPGSAVAGVTVQKVSVLIPARNEAHAIEAAVRSVLASTGVEFEVIVMDDASTDGTAAIVERLALEDARVRLERAPMLPEGWNGKQHACWTLARAATHPMLCFMDADVRLEPECVARMAVFLEQTGCGLVSGFPRQITGTWLEWMMIPLIHFVLLGFLPLGRMRAGVDPALAAGCGQFLVAWKDDYFFTGGHSQIKETMHDGLLLPRLFRYHGFKTDLADITHLARCRMYTSAGQVWSGLAKNATEGLGDPGRIVPVTLLLLLGQVVPFVALGSMAVAFAVALPQVFLLLIHHAFIVGISRTGAFVLGSMALGVFAGWSTRALAATRFDQDWRGALLHPVGMILLLCVQWYALLRKLSGGKVKWKERAYLKPGAP